MSQRDRRRLGTQGIFAVSDQFLNVLAILGILIVILVYFSLLHLIEKNSEVYHVLGKKQGVTVHSLTSQRLLFAQILGHEFPVDIADPSKGRVTLYEILATNQEKKYKDSWLIGTMLHELCPKNNNKCVSELGLYLDVSSNCEGTISDTSSVITSPTAYDYRNNFVLLEQVLITNRCVSLARLITS